MTSRKRAFFLSFVLVLRSRSLRVVVTREWFALSVGGADMRSESDSAYSPPALAASSGFSFRGGVFALITARASGVDKDPTCVGVSLRSLTCKDADVASLCPSPAHGIQPSPKPNRKFVELLEIMTKDAPVDLGKGNIHGEHPQDGHLLLPLMVLAGAWHVGQHMSEERHRVLVFMQKNAKLL
ncbi:hypothetical protein BJ741DRAFT_581908 [Chytriomyces cf. hyalinus JEL632]|nr:hypothetical protein BJ741DRAFT_581908 [Chytriomyces cf. hyalinus JEL632]